jgi:hypothetical protein
MTDEWHFSSLYIYIYVWKLNQTVIELDFRAVNFLFFPRRDLNPHHWYTAAPFAYPYVQRPRPLDHIYIYIYIYASHYKQTWGCRGRDHNNYVSWIYNYLRNQCLSPLKLWVRTMFMARCTRYNIYLIKFVPDLRQVSGFLRLLWFPPPIKLTSTM